MKHEELNRQRREEYRKPPEQEEFLEQLNDELKHFEQLQYRPHDIEHPFLFVIGPPRSGTTLLSQVLAHSLDTGFVNNLAARFWKTPVTGIRFARSVLEDRIVEDFSSRYGATENLDDIHEFGYFWREWLKKESFEHIRDARQMEDQIDWMGLRNTLGNMQAQFDRPMVFKNIYGSYHIPRLSRELEKTLWICIERDPLDTAVSILKARKRYFGDPDTWWSYLPPQYEQIIDSDYWHQISGQIHFLKQFYRRELKEAGNRALTITYRELCDDPSAVLERVRQRVEELYGETVAVRREPPSSLEFRTYEDHIEEKERFAALLKQFENDA